MNKKIIINFTITIICLILLGITAIIKMAELADLSQKLYDHPFTVTNATKTIETEITSMHRYMKDVALSRNEKELQYAVEKVNKSEIIVYKQFEIIFDRYLGQKEDIEKSYQAFVDWKAIRDEVISLMRSNKQQEAANITKGKGAQHVENLYLQVDTLVQYAQNKAIFFNKNTKESKNSAILLVSVLLIVIVAIIIFILILLLKNIAKTDKEIKKHFHVIDQNILSANMDSKFRIKDVSNALIRHLGFEKETLLEKSENFLFSDCDDELKNQIMRVVKSGKEWNGEICKLDISNEEKWLFANIQPTFDENYNVIGYTNIFQDISSKKKIEEISNHDALTNLYNRRFFDYIFSKEIKISQRNKQLLAFIILDIDFFKQYNDTYGHQAGDNTLKKVASTLKSSLHRPNDYAFRLGGEEFGLLFNITSEDDAFKIAENIRQSIESLQINHNGNTSSKYITISMGLTIIHFNEINNIDDIYRATDELLYKAKESGRNKVVFE